MWGAVRWGEFLGPVLNQVGGGGLGFKRRDELPPATKGNPGEATDQASGRTLCVMYPGGNSFRASSRGGHGLRAVLLVVGLCVPWGNRFRASAEGEGMSGAAHRSVVVPGFSIAHIASPLIRHNIPGQAPFPSARARASLGLLKLAIERACAEGFLPLPNARAHSCFPHQLVVAKGTARCMQVQML